VVVGEVLDVLGINLLVGTTLSLLEETLSLGLLGSQVVIKSEANFFLDNLGLSFALLTRLALLAGFALFTRLLLATFYGILSNFGILAPVALSVATLLVTTSATTSAVMTIEWVSFLTGLSFKSILTTTSTTLFSASWNVNDLAVLTSCGKGSSGSIAATSALTITAWSALTITTGSIAATATTTAVTTTAATSVAATTAALIAASRSAILNLFEFLSLVGWESLGNLDGNLFLGLGGLDSDLLNFSDFGSEGFLISEGSKSVCFHVCSKEGDEISFTI
jgi:hypothetical protein